MLKSSLILIVALLTNQVSSLVKNVSPRDLAEDTDSLLQQLKEVVQGSIDSASLRLQTHNEEMMILSNTLVNIGEATITQEYEGIAPKLETIKSSAAASGKDISSCLQYREDIFNGLPESTKNHLIECVVIRGDQVSYIVTRATYTLGQSWERVDELTLQKERCGTGFEGDLCYAEVIGAIPIEMRNIPQRVVSVVDTAAEYVDFAMVSMENCGIEQIARMQTEGNAIIGEIQQCVDELPS